MRCPKCKSTNLAVIASRKQDFHTFNQRYVICKDCNVSFQTIESIIPDTIIEVPNLFLDDEFHREEKNEKKK